jgi:hypothetical protein
VDNLESRKTKVGRQNRQIPEDRPTQPAEAMFFDLEHKIAIRNSHSREWFDASLRHSTLEIRNADKQILDSELPLDKSLGIRPQWLD